jgi:hypothetical protein
VTRRNTSISVPYHLTKSQTRQIHATFRLVGLGTSFDRFVKIATPLSLFAKPLFTSPFSRPAPRVARYLGYSSITRDPFDHDRAYAGLSLAGGKTQSGGCRLYKPQSPTYREPTSIVRRYPAEYPGWRACRFWGCQRAIARISVYIARASLEYCHGKAHWFWRSCWASGGAPNSNAEPCGRPRCRGSPANRVACA